MYSYVHVCVNSVLIVRPKSHHCRRPFGVVVVVLVAGTSPHLRNASLSRPLGGGSVRRRPTSARHLPTIDGDCRAAVHGRGQAVPGRHGRRRRRRAGDVLVAQDRRHEVRGRVRVMGVDRCDVSVLVHYCRFVCVPSVPTRKTHTHLKQL